MLAVAGQAGAQTNLPPGQTAPQAATRSDTTATIPSARYVPYSQGALPDDELLGGPQADPRSLMRPSQTPAAGTQATPRRAPTEETPEPARPGTRQRSIDALDLDRNEAVRPEATRVPPVEIGERRVEEDPYAPLGIRAGAFILRPSLQQGVEYTTNASGTASGGTDVLSESTLRLNAASDWSRHSLTLDAFGTYRRSIRGTGFEEFLGGADAAAAVDLGYDYRLLGTLGYARRPESATSAVMLPDTASQPIRQTIIGSLGLEKALGPLRLRATGHVDRNSYGDVALAAGGTLSQTDRDQTLYALRLRTGYEVSPGFQPFLEAEAGRRLYDNRLDAAGYARSANRLAARAGAAVDLGEKLGGELALGYVGERFDDDRLGTLGAFTVDGRASWSPVRGTTVTLSGATEIEGATTAGERGSVLYSATLGVERQLRANLTGNAALGLTYRNYAGSNANDLTWSGQLGATWWLNRYAGLTGRLRHEQRGSTIADRNSRTTSAFVGVNLQR